MKTKLLAALVGGIVAGTSVAEWAKVDIDDPVQKAKLTERINRVKNHHAA